MVTKEEALRGLGLSEKEANVWLSLLPLGQAKVNEIALEASLNRITAYDILKGLAAKGLVSYVIKSGVKYFEVTPPSKLLDSLREKEAKVKEVLPELEELAEAERERVHTEQYSGLEGLKSIFNDVLKENKESWFLADINLVKNLEFYFPHFILQKRKRGQFSKVICPPSDFMRDYKRKAPKKSVAVRFLGLSVPATRIIYGDKTAYLTFNGSDSIGVIVKSKDITATERELFNFLWTKAKE